MPTFVPPTPPILVPPPNPFGPPPGSEPLPKVEDKKDDPPEAEATASEEAPPAEPGMYLNSL